MGKKIPDAGLDLLLEDVRVNVDKMTLCASEPATYADATSGTDVFLAEATLASDDFTVADGDVDGRKITVAAQEGVSITNSGTCNHVVLVDTAAEVIKAITTCDGTSVSAGGTADVGSFKITLRDPT